MTCFSDVKVLNQTLMNVRKNESKIIEFESAVSTKFEQNFKSFSTLLSKAKTVASILTSSMSIYTQFGVYMQSLIAHINNLMTLNAYLSNLIISKTITSNFTTGTLDPFMRKMRDVQIQLIPLQQRIILLCKVAINKISLAEQNVAISVKSTSDSDTKEILKDLKLELIDAATVNDYSMVAWPNLPDLPKPPASIKLRSAVCDIKRADYEMIQENAETNRSKIEIHRKALDASTATAQSSLADKKVKAQLPVIADVIQATILVENAYIAYINKLEWALNETELLREQYTSDCGKKKTFN